MTNFDLQKLTRRQALQLGLAGAAGLVVPRYAGAAAPASAAKPKATADSMILIWLPGGVAQTDTWDPKKYTPYTQGMKGSQILGTCESIPTKADGIRLGAGLENIASVMDKSTVLRSLTSDTKFGAIHLKAQYYAMTGYLFPAGVAAPSMGAVVSRTLGRRDPNVPAYIDLCRDINTSNEEMLFINEFNGPGFYGVKHAPFMIPNPSQGLPTLNAVAGMDMTRLDRRQHYLEAITGLSSTALQTAHPAKDYMKVMEDARAMMDSPVKRAFAFMQEEKPETIKAYDVGHRFGFGCLLARRLVEKGARFVEVEYQYEAFAGFDMHADGQSRMVAMKAQIDRPIAQLVRDLDQRGLLDRTLIVVMTEFGRTIANQPAAGTEAFGFAERATGDDLIIANEKMYGFHGHFSSGNSMLFFGGGFKKGFAYGKTADIHPMIPTENPVRLEDVHATIYKAMGIPADTSYVTEGRPFYVTNNGKGVPIEAMLA
ncbi:sulfatase [Capsulimonas corticalis]|uniref:Sulfatase n=1 Tax=Capsulimonas corticalis TaxID=2219043 RepID=A0A402CTB7_9BACT|nr:DUF1501 domain-containing protein [Capsulimonas corticalis]BDI30794.1 sulfatase [Capsulimonas corticalis]